MSLLPHIVSSAPPALAHMLAVTAQAWGLSELPVVVQGRVDLEQALSA